jgi:hypothetical protein
MCTRIDDFHERHPVLAYSIAIAICFACEIAINHFSQSGGDAMPSVINHVGGFSV